MEDNNTIIASKWYVECLVWDAETEAIRDFINHNLQPQCRYFWEAIESLGDRLAKLEDRLAKLEKQ